MQVDVAVIGAAPPALARTRAAKAAGANTVLIEGGDYGTTCARVGCMPSKLLIAAAMPLMRRAGTGVWHPCRWRDSRIDGREVMDRVRRERDRFVGFALRDVQGIPRPSACAARPHSWTTIRWISPAIHGLRQERGYRHRFACRLSGYIQRTGRPPYHQRRRVRLDRSAQSRGRDRSRDNRAGAGSGTASSGCSGGGCSSRRPRRPDQRSGIRAYALSAFNRNSRWSQTRISPTCGVTATASPSGAQSEMARRPSSTSTTFSHRPAARQCEGDSASKTPRSSSTPRACPHSIRRPPGPRAQTGQARCSSPRCQQLHSAAARSGGRGAHRWRECRASSRWASRSARAAPRAPSAVVFTDPQIAIVGRGYRSLRPGTFATGR